MTIGSGSAVPQVKRSSPCHLVRKGDSIIVVDLGPGSIWGLLRYAGVSLKDVGLILLTHLHMDHCADLAPMLFALRSRELARTKPLLIMGPPGLADHYEKLRMTWEHRVEPCDFELMIEEWSGEVFSWEGFTINAALMSHSIENLAWRIDHEAARCGIVVTGDGKYTEEVISLADSAEHILVAECAAGAQGDVVGHMNAVEAGQMAAVCGSEKLILCHINPGSGTREISKAVLASFEGEVVVAGDGMEIEIG